MINLVLVIFIFEKNVYVLLQIEVVNIVDEFIIFNKELIK